MISEALWGTPIPRLPTLGTLDLGGASTQITFAPEDPSTVPEGNKVSLRLYGTDYVLYTHSFLCYGANEARRRMEANLVKVGGGYSCFDFRNVFQLVHLVITVCPSFCEPGSAEEISQQPWPTLLL